MRLAISSAVIFRRVLGPRYTLWGEHGRGVIPEAAG